MRDPDEASAKKGEATSATRSLPTPTPPTPLDRPTARVSPRKQLSPGDELGRFTIVGLLGAGGMGTVYRANDKELGRQVAIKVLSVEVEDEANDGLFATRLMREAQALAKLSHPNVIAIYDVAHERGLAFVAMELVEGQSLKRWLRGATRTRAEIVEMFTQAGHGLAAAHAAGLVHRDFKPDNAVVGTDGRLRVLDFGLARTAGASALRTGETPALALGSASSSSASSGSSSSSSVSGDEPSAASDDRNPWLDSSPSLSGSSLLDSPLTQVGLVLGTPTYMAPEQHRGGEVDARSDQFSFCVALYQALYGQAPFGGKRRDEFRANVLGGKVRPAPAESDVPVWLRRVILRGLAVEPEARHPSMDALLAALAADPDAVRHRRLRTIALVATVGALGLLATWGLLRPRLAALDPCAGAAGELQGTWDATRRGAIEKAFAGSGRSYAAETFTRVTKGLDAYAHGWTAMRGETCRATRVAGRQSELVFDLRVRCLDRRKAAFGALASLLGEKPDPELVDNALDAVLKLPALEGCADVDALSMAVPLPEDPSVRKAVEAVQAKLDRTEALDRAGKFQDADPIAHGALDDARKIAHPPLLARALTVAATVKVELDAAKEAEPLFEEAVRAAAEAKDNTAVLNAWTGVISARKIQGRYADALALRLPAEAALTLAGNAPLLRAGLDKELGETLWLDSRYDEARPVIEGVLKAREKYDGPESASVAEAAMQLGDVLADKGDPAAARPFVERAYAINKKVFGPHHPQTALAMNSLALLMRDLGDYAPALPLLEQARAIFEESLGPESVNVGLMWANLAGVHERLGHAAEATPAFKRAAEIIEKALGPDHPIAGFSLFVYGRHLTDLDRAPEAEPLLRRAVGILEKAVGPEHRNTASARASLGFTLCVLGHPGEGLKLMDTARRTLEKLLEPKHTDLTTLASKRARCEVLQKR